LRRASVAADPAFARKVVTYSSPVPPGTIVIDPANHFLYLVQSDFKITVIGPTEKNRNRRSRFGVPANDSPRRTARCFAAGPAMTWTVA
jgi:hypothetical protein